MGGIAIWCMHYIGNRAIVLDDGQTVLQIAYNPGFTALSFFVPILVLLAAFIALGSDDRVSIFRVSMGASLAGSAICGMHYLGQAGISNYTSVYDVKNVVGSAVIAIAASIVALSVFFVPRVTWTNSWWKRALCAIILAGAVSGMHWLASVGTQYRLKNISIPSGSNNLKELDCYCRHCSGTSAHFSLLAYLVSESLLIRASLSRRALSFSYLPCLHSEDDLDLPTELSR